MSDISKIIDVSDDQFIIDNVRYNYRAMIDDISFQVNNLNKEFLQNFSGSRNIQLIFYSKDNMFKIINNFYENYLSVVSIFSKIDRSSSENLSLLSQMNEIAGLMRQKLNWIEIFSNIDNWNGNPNIMIKLSR